MVLWENDGEPQLERQELGVGGPSLHPDYAVFVQHRRKLEQRTAAFQTMPAFGRQIPVLEQRLDLVGEGLVLCCSPQEVFCLPEFFPLEWRHRCRDRFVYFFQQTRC
uniref:(northern house mosquito) hypothetical protein n=1 Tax=Culex pipiens TaxID=7175 RepID=A0A8D8AQA1_CULPI